MYARTLTKETHVHRFLITQQPGAGWEVREETDDTVVRRAYYEDWHRVERAQRAFALTEQELRGRGWVD